MNEVEAALDALSWQETVGLQRVVRRRAGPLNAWLWSCVSAARYGGAVQPLCPAGWTTYELRNALAAAGGLSRVLRREGLRRPRALLTAVLDVLLAEYGERARS